MPDQSGLGALKHPTSFGSTDAVAVGNEIGLVISLEKDFVSGSPYLAGMPMDLRHLRYFVAVAEEGNLTGAAEKRLHTAQPSLSRQMRDLEAELGCTLMTRGAKGIELTDAGRVFLDHARVVLIQVCGFQ